jgi:diguanylate cyclase (GGDEF)-like protein
LKIRRIFLLNTAFALFAASVIFSLSQSGFLSRLELFGLDLSFRLRSALPVHPKIVIIEITDSDIAKIGRWPWKRSWLAAMTQALSKFGAKYVYFDIILSEASTDEDDALLEEAIKVNKNVYLPFVFQFPSYDLKNAITPLKGFSLYLKGTGATNVYPDIDGSLRKLPILFGTKEKSYPHIALKLAMDYLGLKIKETKANEILLSGAKEEIRIPLVEKNKMLINWLGKWRHTFKHYGFLQVLNGYKDYLDKKTPTINLDDFKDSICLVGITAIGLYDINSVPLEPEYPGIGIIATAINNILKKDFLYYPPSWINILILYLLSLIPAFLIRGEKPFRETLFVFLVTGSYFLINQILFRNGISLDLSFHLSGILTSSLVVGTYNFFRVAVERQSFFKMSITDGLTGLYNIGYFKLLLDAEVNLAKQNPTKKFSIVMADIDYFKKFNDTYGHQVGDLVLKEVAGVLKNSLRASDVVARYGGEEMIVLLWGSPLKEALIIAEKIRKNIENHIVHDQQKIYKITVSFGVAAYKPEDNIETLIKRADDGLYKAKQSGRNRACCLEEPESIS